MIFGCESQLLISRNQRWINPMAEAAYAAGPALFGAGRFVIQNYENFQ